MRLRMKMLITILGSVAAVFIAVWVFVMVMSTRDAQKSAEALSMEATRAAATNVARVFEVIDSKGGTLARVISAMDRSSGDARRRLPDLLQGVLEDIPNAKAVWCAFEPDAFDGLDVNFSQSEWFGRSGRANFMIQREGADFRRSLELSDKDMNAVDFYSQPFQSGKHTLSEPSMRDFDGGPLFIMTLSIPVRSNGKIIGVLGIDIDLKPIQERVAKVRTTKNSSPILVSNAGLIIQADNKDIINKNLSVVNAKMERLQDVLSAIREGKELIFYDYSVVLRDEALRTYAPVSIPNIGTALSFFNMTPRAEALASATRLTNNILVAFIIGLVAIALMVWFLVARIVKPIIAITERIQDFANLNFNPDPSKRWLMDYKDEIGDVAKAFGTLQQNIVMMLVQLDEELNRFSDNAQALAALSEEAVASAEEVKASLDEASYLSDSTASSLNSTNSAVEEVSQSAIMAAGAVTDGAEASNKTFQLSSEVSSQMDTVVSRINDVSDKSKQSNESTRKVANSVAVISNFVSTITSIADQTNLLALNAAIEAARAGESGRGFAVVAEEVRKLAEESNAAAKEVSSLITSLQTDSYNAGVIISEVEAILGDAVVITHEAKEQLNESLHQIESVNSIMQNMAGTSQQQADASQNIASTVANITQANDKTVETLDTIKRAMDETAHGSERVAEEAQQVSEGVGKLRSIADQFTYDREWAMKNSKQENTGSGLVKIGK